MVPEAALGIGLGFVTIVCLFVILPWMILNFLSKARKSNGLTDEAQAALEKLTETGKSLGLDVRAGVFE